MILNTSILKQILVALGGDPDYGDNSVATERKIVNAVGGNGNDYNDNEASLLKRWLLQIGGTPVYADNEDKTLGKILEQYGGGLGVFLNPTGKLEAILSQINATPPSPPEMLSIVINEDGETLTVTFSESMTGTGIGALGFIESTETYGISYVSGAGDSVYIYAITPTVPSSATLTFNYSPGDLVGSESGLPLEGFTLKPSTNNSTWDADALAFISRASLSDADQKSAVNTLTVDLKSASLWSKMVALYPFAGGNATAHSKNLKADAFNITWSGTVTHDANGITGDGSTGYGDTGLNPSTSLDVTSCHIAVYVRSGTSGANGALEGGGESFLGFTPFSDNNAYFDITNNNSSIGRVMAAFSAGFLLGSRVSSTDLREYINGTQVDFTTGLNSTALPDLDLFTLSLNNGGTPSNFADYNMAFLSFGDGLAPSESTVFNDIITAFQTALGRSV